MGNGQCCASNSASKIGGTYEHLSPEWDLSAVQEIAVRDDIIITLQQADVNILETKWHEFTKGQGAKRLSNLLFEKLMEYFPDNSMLFFSDESSEFITGKQWKQNPYFVSHIKEVIKALEKMLSLAANREHFDDYVGKLEELHRCFTGLTRIHYEVNPVGGHWYNYE